MPMGSLPLPIKAAQFVSFGVKLKTGVLASMKGARTSVLPAERWKLVVSAPEVTVSVPG